MFLSSRYAGLLLDHGEQDGMGKVSIIVIVAMYKLVLALQNELCYL
jgi:hypothetical protein